MIWPWTVRRRYRHLRRYQQVAEVLLRHGFGYAVQRLGLLRLLPLHFRLRRAASGAAAPGGTAAGAGTAGARVGELPFGRDAAVRLRRALEDLGPTFVKLGQVLSLRADLLPPEWVAELERLQDRVAPVSFERVSAVIREELGAGPELLFAEFDQSPLASASLGQVHRARLRNGTAVVVKVQRPGIEQLVRTDLEILQSLATLAQERLRPSLLDPEEMVREFARVMGRELDYTIEGRNMERFRANFRDDPRVHIPAVFWELSSPRVLTMELVEGIKVNDVAALRRAGFDPARIARAGAELFLKMVLEDGFFHGDPHPGNLFIRPSDGRLAIIDFGIVGRLRPETMMEIAGLFVSIVRQDVDRAVTGLTRLGVLREESDPRRLKQDLQDLVDRHYGKSLSELRLGEIVRDGLALIYRHHLRLPADLLLLARALAILDGLGREMDPTFNALTVARPFATRLLLRRLEPEQVAHRLWERASRALQLVEELPAKVDAVLTEAGRGRLVVQFQHRGVEEPVARIAGALDRVAVAIAAGALLGASALLIAQGFGPTVRGVSVIGGVGFVVSVVLSLGVILSGLRRHRS